MPESTLPGDHYIPILGDIENEVHSLLDFKGLDEAMQRFTAKNKGLLGLQPLTRTTKNELATLIDHFMNPPGSKVESAAVKSYLTGALLDIVDDPTKIQLDRLPKTFTESAKTLPIQQARLKLQSDRLGNEIQAISDTARTQVIRTILDAKLNNQQNPRKLAQVLSDTQWSDTGNLNRDWRRVAITEAANLHSAGYLDTVQQSGGAQVKWFASPKACDSCRQYAGKVFTLGDAGVDYAGLDPDSDDYSAAHEYATTHIWQGKSNFGRYQSTMAADGHARHGHELWLPTIPLHPNCRCRWVRE